MQETSPKKIRYSFVSLGTDIELQIVTSDGHKLFECGKYFQEVEKKYLQTMQTFSRFDDKSELSQLNNSLDEFHECSSWMQVVALRALEYYKDTKGIFDPRIIDTLEGAGYDKDFKQISLKNVDPQRGLNNFQTSLQDDLIIEGTRILFKKRMDFSGLVKGFITDEVARYLESEGFENFLIDSGGDLFAKGGDFLEEKWYVSLEGVSEEKMMLGISKDGIATSGITRRKWEAQGKRFHHIINPQKPQEFAFDLKSVTVVASSTEQADVWAKVLFLKGENEGKKYAQEHELKCIFLNYKNIAWISDELKKIL